MANNDKSTASKPSDLDIMMYLDGELPAEQAERVEKFLASDDLAKAKATSLGQISALVQGSLELEADAADHKLAGLWSGIDKAIHANGASAEGPAKSVAPAKSAAQRAEDRATDALTQHAHSSWLGGWQSHILTGAIVAVAVAVVMFASRPETSTQQTTVIRQPSQPVSAPLALASQAPEVEELEVYDGSGVVMTIPGDDEVGGESASTVIWISSDSDVSEDPI
jgi:anti-sigma factor RsiW